MKTTRIPTCIAAVWLRVSSRYQVTNGITGTNQFYRLRKPLP